MVLVYRITAEIPNAPHDLLYGATMGEAHAAPLFARLTTTPPGTPVIIDFTGIAAVTASYLKTTIIRLVDAAVLSTGLDDLPQSLRSKAEAFDVFPFVAGCSPDVVEEIGTVLESRSLPLLEAVDWAATGVTHARLHGVLERALREALTALMGQESATATALARLGGPNPTAWNNRLAELHRLRLATRERVGKQLVFRRVAREVEHGV